MLSLAYILNFAGMILLPILLGIWLARKYGLSWKLLLAGALTFIASQVLHIPVVYGLTAAFQRGLLPAIPAGWVLLFNAVLLGLLAGIFEETARYILFKFILKKERTWEAGVVVGMGHGGIEAALLGLAAGLAFLQMTTYRGIDLATIPTIPPEQLELARQQVTAYWASPVPHGLSGTGGARLCHLPAPVALGHGPVCPGPQAAALVLAGASLARPGGWDRCVLCPEDRHPAAGRRDRGHGALQPRHHVLPAAALPKGGAEA